MFPVVAGGSCIPVHFRICRHTSEYNSIPGVIPKTSDKFLLSLLENKGRKSTSQQYSQSSRDLSTKYKECEKSALKQ